jgi:hypothetical protein
VGIGRVRVFFDGTRGGQETTFGQDETYDADANEKARRESAFVRCATCGPCSAR